MTDPKVSERMEALLLDVVMDARTHERNGDRYTRADYEESEAALLSAIAEIEQRAEKWKEVALAKSLLEIAKCTSNLDDFSTLLKHAVEREKAAIAALGDEWDEAVR